jgi:hypothetical protein
MCDSWTKNFCLASPTTTVTGSESKLREISLSVNMQIVISYDGPSVIERLNGLEVDMPFRLIVAVAGNCERC